MKDISKQNAKVLGLDTLLWQTQEECGELVKAVGKYNRTRGIGQRTETSEKEAYQNLLIELADVSICIEQLVYLLNAEDDIEALKDEAFEKVKKQYAK